MGVLAWQPAGADKMFRVAANMNEAYYGSEEVQQRKSNLEAPRVTVNNHRMTNVQLPGGQVVQGIRRNNDLGYENQPPVAYESEQPLRPLRYTPGLKCDPALEAMRPERSMKHQALQGGDQWKKKLIQHPQTYEGSFADADMQQFRPDPIPNPMEDPWVMSRLPDQPVGASMPYDGYGVPGYPQDDLARIKMRNRRFQQSCAAEQGIYGPPMPPAQLRAQPWIAQGPIQGPPPMMTEDMMLGGPPMFDELAMIDQDLNMTRRATRPFVPTQDPAYCDLQRQVQLLESLPNTCVRAPRVNVDDILGTDQLPAPTKRAPKPAATEAPPAPPKQRQVGIADQIAIRSYVLGKSIGKSSASE